jgi:hypothetical protein
MFLTPSWIRSDSARYTDTIPFFPSAISNPNTSNEAKAEAEKKLYDLEHGPQGKNLGNVAGGLKA